jgi:glycosyltransferase involved in cell wall biosynthesis
MSRERVIAVVVENHYIATPQGVFARQGMGHPYAYWAQLLDHFDRVHPIARAARADAPDPAWKRSDGPGVEFITIRDHAGLRQIVRTLPHTLRTFHRGLAAGDHVFIRGGGSMSTLSWLYCRALGVPYARQVVGRDGEAVYVGLPHVPRAIRRLAASTADWLARRQIAGASCAAYVAPILREMYPAAAGAPVFFFSDVSLDTEVITRPRQAHEFSATPLRLVSVGRLNPEKGHRVLLQALAGLDRAGQGQWTLELIGPGPETDALAALSQELGLDDRVTLSGLVPWGPRLFERLDAADLFVLPSLTEGLPRAVLEAMSRGLPAIGSAVGGVPDILDPDALVPPGNPDALAESIGRYMSDRDRLARASTRGFDTAMGWRLDVMNAQKKAFFGAIQGAGRARRT